MRSSELTMSRHCQPSVVRPESSASTEHALLSAVAALSVPEIIIQSKTCYKSIIWQPCGSFKWLVSTDLKVKSLLDKFSEIIVMYQSCVPILGFICITFILFRWSFRRWAQTLAMANWSQPNCREDDIYIYLWRSVYAYEVPQVVCAAVSGLPFACVEPQ